MAGVHFGHVSGSQRSFQTNRKLTKERKATRLAALKGFTAFTLRTDHILCGGVSSASCTVLEFCFQ